MPVTGHLTPAGSCYPGTGSPLHSGHGCCLQGLQRRDHSFLTEVHLFLRRSVSACAKGSKDMVHSGQLFPSGASQRAAPWLIWRSGQPAPRCAFAGTLSSLPIGSVRATSQKQPRGDSISSLLISPLHVSIGGGVGALLCRMPIFAQGLSLSQATCL